ncbi:WD40/YVTN/BNR-like repeat-containing protein [Alicyclobacillus dauci]|uniref:Photosynthesis system II assembly factor Ycf48/Hcf136-like domain-containing protein n=1 Tax=Alicyclobacillus dauci TaxID=1475485 RepID=A0ABY6Z3A7_9BACL|nr:hypothetical protein [Alicyclobacillus dauci]WAH36455.1 hypothetical protein NZD86_19900 [Alicyclobacillus dauci]
MRKLALTGLSLIALSIACVGLNAYRVVHVAGGGHELYAAGQGAVTASDIQMVSEHVQTSPVESSSLTGVSFISTSVGFLAGNDGIYKTADGGKTWSRLYHSNDPVLGVQAKYQPEGSKQYVVAYTKTNLLVSTNGKAFSKETVPNIGTFQFEGVSLLDNGVMWVLNNGSVLGSDPMTGQLKDLIPGKKVGSLALSSPEVGYVTVDQSILKTTDHGQHWTKVFTAPLKNGPWRTKLEATGNHVAVLFYGGDAGMGQSAYILYQSNDAGRTWDPTVSEGYFSSDYMGARPRSGTNAGEQPGPFKLLPTGELFMLGLKSNHGGLTTLTGFTSRGKFAFQRVVGTDRMNVFDFLNAPIAISAVDSQHIWVVGSKDKHPVILRSKDGGLSWMRA